MIMDEVNYEAHLFMIDGRKQLRRRNYVGRYGINLPMEVKIDNLLIVGINQEYQKFKKKK